MASLNILLPLLLGTHVRVTIVCVSFDYLLLEHPLNGFLIVWLISLPKAPERRNADHGNGRPCRLFFFLFYFFHFSKMRSWGLSGREHGGDERVTWPTLPVDGIPHRHPETCFFFFKRLLDVFIFGISFFSLTYKYDNFLNNCWFSLDSVSTLLAVPRRFLHPDSLKITKTVACSTGNRPNGKPKVFYFVCFFY